MKIPEIACIKCLFRCVQRLTGHNNNNHNQLTTTSDVAIQVVGENPTSADNEIRVEDWDDLNGQKVIEESLRDTNNALLGESEGDGGQKRESELVIHVSQLSVDETIENVKSPTVANDNDAFVFEDGVNVVDIAFNVDDNDVTIDGLEYSDSIDPEVAMAIIEADENMENGGGESIDDVVMIDVADAPQEVKNLEEQTAKGKENVKVGEEQQTGQEKKPTPGETPVENIIKSTWSFFATPMIGLVNLINANDTSSQETKKTDGAKENNVEDKENAKADDSSKADEFTGVKNIGYTEETHDANNETKPKDTDLKKDSPGRKSKDSSPKSKASGLISNVKKKLSPTSKREKTGGIGSRTESCPSDLSHMDGDEGAMTRRGILRRDSSFVPPRNRRRSVSFRLHPEEDTEVDEEVLRERQKELHDVSMAKSQFINKRKRSHARKHNVGKYL